MKDIAFSRNTDVQHLCIVWHFGLWHIGQVIFFPSKSVHPSNLQIYGAQPTKITDRQLIPTFTSFFSCFKTQVFSWESIKKTSRIQFEQIMQLATKHKKIQAKLWPFTVWQRCKSDRKSFWLLEILTLSAAPIMLWSFQRVHRNSWSFATERKTFCTLKCMCIIRTQLISRPVFFPEAFAGLFAKLVLI